MRADGHQPLIGVLRAAGRERGEPGVDAADGRLVAPVPVLRQSADGAPPAARGRGGGAPSSPAPDGPDWPGGDLPQAAHERRAAGSPRLPVPAARTEDRPSGPGVVRGHHVHPGDDRLYCTWSRSWTGPADMCCRGGCRTRWTAASASRRWRRRCRRGRPASSTPTRGRSSRARRSPTVSRLRARGARWTAAVGAWITSSSSGSGGR